MIIRDKNGKFIKGVAPYPENLFKKGQLSLMKGRHHSEETKKKLSLIQRGKKLTEKHKRNISSGHKREKAYQWKENEAHYSSIHKWLIKWCGKATYCSNDISHVAKRYVWANISGAYKRDISDYRPLCNSCNLLDDRVSKGKLFDEFGRRRS